MKSKLEVGASEAEPEDVAERSRSHSRADLMRANALEGMHDWAVTGAGPGGCRHASRAGLASHSLESASAV